MGDSTGNGSGNGHESFRYRLLEPNGCKYDGNGEQPTVQPITNHGDYQDLLFRLQVGDGGWDN